MFIFLVSIFDPLESINFESNNEDQFRNDKKVNKNNLLLSVSFLIYIIVLRLVVNKWPKLLLSYEEENYLFFNHALFFVGLSLDSRQYELVQKMLPTYLKTGQK